ncbi:hypothetical protein LIER_23647 [Lithospermum erythrorhizon]|uniref:Uncharacterized protein n=1 Tax=Lithospermum erythrorhizon TaxID=34254 RepID=A0AAV3R0L5_LITER
MHLRESVSNQALLCTARIVNMQDFQTSSFCGITFTKCARYKFVMSNTLQYRRLLMTSLMINHKWLKQQNWKLGFSIKYVKERFATLHVPQPAQHQEILMGGRNCKSKGKLHLHLRKP